MNESNASTTVINRLVGQAGSNRRAIMLAYFFVLVLVVVGGILAPGFVAPASLTQQLVLASVLGVITIGATVVILTGNIDLSVSWTMNLCSVVVTAVTVGENTKIVQAIVLALAVGAAIGLLNGLGVAYLRLPSMVLTLGVNGMLRGLTLVVTGAQPKGTAPGILQWLVGGRILGVPPCVLLWLGLGMLTIFVLVRTYFGRTLYTTGNSQTVSFLSGIRTQRTLVLAFVVSGMCNAMAGILFLSYSGQVYLSLGEPYQMPAIAAVVIGGVSILGGSGSYVGVIAGTLILVLLQNVLSLANVKYAGQLIIYGVAILGMLFVYGRSAADRD